MIDDDTINAVDQITSLFDYVESKVGKEKANELLTKIGFDDIEIIKVRTLEQNKKIIDKYLMFNKMLRENLK